MEEYKASFSKIQELAGDISAEKKYDGPHQDMSNPNAAWVNEKWINPQAFLRLWGLYEKHEEMQKLLTFLEKCQVALYKLSEF